MSIASLKLSEWQTVGPADDARLQNAILTPAPEVQRLVSDLAAQKKLEILELARGLEVRTSSWIGRIGLGGLSITIEPKLKGMPLLQLLRYTYGLRELQLLDDVVHDVASGNFQDLLVYQLLVEVTELLGRGLHRSYRPRAEVLPCPRGRIDFSRYAATGGSGRAALPCEYYPLSESVALNRALLAGLRFAVRATDDLALRARLRKLAARLEQTISVGPMDSQLLRQAMTELDRRTYRYRPALTLIGLLLESCAVSLDSGDHELQLHSFLFDMNRFFQALLSRFLRENLPDDFLIQDEYRLQGMLNYDAMHNPRGRKAPTPRPDFAILREGRVVAILDAKYRDLWTRSLPREMLYQLAMYALSHGAVRKAIILYPAMASGAVDQIIALNEPLGGGRRAEIVLRPVKLFELQRLIQSPGQQGQAARESMALQLVFGEAGVAIPARYASGREARPRPSG